MSNFLDKLTIEEIEQLSKGSGEVEILTPADVQERLQALQEFENGK